MYPVLFIFHLSIFLTYINSFEYDVTLGLKQPHIRGLVQQDVFFRQKTLQLYLKNI
jgi:hypothetical protein